MLTWKRDSSQSPTSRQRSRGNYGVLRAREIVFPREEQPSWLSNTKWSGVKHYMDYAGCIYIFRNVCVTTIKEKNVMNLRARQGKGDMGGARERKGKGNGILTA